MAFLDLTQECLDAAEGELAPPERGARKRMRIQVFKNEFIENWFAQAHPITPGIWFGWIVVYGLYVGFTQYGLLAGLGLFLFGMLLTSLIEYCLHRFLFHFEAKTKFQRLQLFLIHGYHHDYPNDPMRLVLPPIGIWPVAALIALVWYFVFGQYFWVVFGGTAAGYIAYDWTHYYTHHFNPKTGVGRWLKRYHMLHHHDSPNHRYGITSPLWDVIFGTYLPTNKMVRQAGRHVAAE